MTAAPSLVADRYRLLQPLGAGGMGRVWRAQDETLHRDVAVKQIVLPPELLDSARDVAMERTLREARAAARLSHPNVVRVYDVLAAEGHPWLVMEYVPSRSLDEVIRADGPLEPKRVAEIGLAVLDALQAAHRAGVDHRDIKPGNVLLAQDGRVVLTDFGIARVEGEGHVTRTGLVLGSPEYIAPERAREGIAGPASDLWSLGATLYAAVEGRSPFGRGSAMETLTALASEEADPPQRAGSMEPTLRALLRKDPRARAGFAETAELLRAAVTEQPVRRRRSWLSGWGRPAAPATQSRPARQARGLPSGPGAAPGRAVPPAAPVPPQRTPQQNPDTIVKPAVRGMAAVPIPAPAPPAEEAPTPKPVTAREPEVAPQEPEVAAHEPETAPQDAEVAARDTEAAAHEPETVPQDAEVAAHKPETAPQDAEVAARDTEAAAHEPETVPQDAEVAAHKPETAPQDAEAAARDTGATAHEPETAPQDAEAAAQEPAATLEPEIVAPEPEAIHEPETADEPEATTEPAAVIEPEAAAEEPETAHEPEASAAEPEAAHQPETAAAEPETDREPETTDAEPETAHQPETAAAEPETDREPEAAAVPEPEAVAVPEPEATAEPETVAEPQAAEVAEPAARPATGAAVKAEPPAVAVQPERERRGHGPAVAPPVGVGKRGPGRTTPKAAVLAGVAALVAVSLIVWLAVGSGDDKPGGETAAPARSAGTAPATTAAPSPTANDASPTGQAPSSAAAGPTSAAPSSTLPPLPPGWIDYHDPTGFSVYVPAGWRQSKERSIMYFRDSGSGKVLGIDQTSEPKPDPVADWQAQRDSRIRGGDFKNYAEVRLQPVGYFQKAADWEFTFDGSGGRRHVNNRGVITSPTQAYGIYWQTKDSDWEAARPELQLVFDSFRPKP
ncbi:protein kinase [Dactylosporangium fulvum]|uniref:non-specific serine/threonine protein kinase n=1 Tax=Dactylosporangium fulvum TaxID=53359 RepID=A0ABY5VRK8_9ACTN|nr:serine/threonine protein kinase [Dactylosporangium fulvum]UWP79441.1 protein kinase [Dactylosporangium fulvum]